MADLLNDHHKPDPIPTVAGSAEDADKGAKETGHNYSRVFEDWLNTYRSRLAKGFQDEPISETANTHESADAES